MSLLALILLPFPIINKFPSAHEIETVYSNDESSIENAIEAESQDHEIMNVTENNEQGITFLRSQVDNKKT